MEAILDIKSWKRKKDGYVRIHDDDPVSEAQFVALKRISVKSSSITLVNRFKDGEFFELGCKVKSESGTEYTIVLFNEDLVTVRILEDKTGLGLYTIVINSLTKI